MILLVVSFVLRMLALKVGVRYDYGRKEYKCKRVHV